MCYIVVFITGLILPFVASGLSRLFELDAYDTRCIILVSIFFSSFCIFLGLFGIYLFYFVR